MRTRLTAVTSLLVATTLAVLAEEPNIRGLGFLGGNMVGNTIRYESRASDVSGMGNVIVGWSTTPGNHAREAFRWTLDEGLQGLGFIDDTGNSQANAVSNDGSTIVGAISANVHRSEEEAFRWTSQTGLQGLGTLPGNDWSTATGVNRTGSVIVGNATRLDPTYLSTAFVWYAPGSMFPLERSFTGSSTGANDTSANDFVAGGSSVSLDGFPHPVVWNAGSIIPVVDQWGGVTGVSKNGQYVVGELPGSSGFSSSGFLWDGITLTTIPFEPSIGSSVAPSAVTPDGRTVVGTGYNVRPGNAGAIIWTADEGTRNLNDVLVNDYGIDLDGWYLLTASSISDDGKTIVGYGFHDGTYEAFRVYLGDGCRADFNEDEVLNIFDVIAFLAAFDAQDAEGDWNEDDVFNIFDVIAFLADFDAGC